MFSLRDFIMKGIRAMVGKEPEYKVRQTALGWLDKGLLTESDLEEIDVLLTQPEPEEAVIPEEEIIIPEPETTEGNEAAADKAAAMPDVSETDVQETDPNFAENMSEVESIPDEP